MHELALESIPLHMADVYARNKCLLKCGVQQGDMAQCHTMEGTATRPAKASSKKIDIAARRRPRRIELNATN